VNLVCITEKTHSVVGTYPDAYVYIRTTRGQLRCVVTKRGESLEGQIAHNRVPHNVVDHECVVGSLLEERRILQTLHFGGLAATNAGVVPLFALRFAVITACKVRVILTDEKWYAGDRSAMACTVMLARALAASSSSKQYRRLPLGHGPKLVAGGAVASGEAECSWS
jgi:hypothetical protein